MCSCLLLQSDYHIYAVYSRIMKGSNSGEILEPFIMEEVTIQSYKDDFASEPLYFTLGVSFK